MSGADVVDRDLAAEFLQRRNQTRRAMSRSSSGSRSVTSSTICDRRIGDRGEDLADLLDDGLVA